VVVLVIVVLVQMVLIIMANVRLPMNVNHSNVEIDTTAHVIPGVMMAQNRMVNAVVH
jgi:hypothetical protein